MTQSGKTAGPQMPGLLAARMLRLCSLLLLALAMPVLAPQVLAQGDFIENQEQEALARVNINEADADTIASRLDGIGESRARAIVEYRDQHGPYASIEELSEVKGIGQATLERNREKIRLR